MGVFPQKKRFKSLREYRDLFVWSQSINSRKASFSGIAPIETRTVCNHLWKWFSVQELPDMVEAEFYLGRRAIDLCVGVGVCVLWKQKRLSNPDKTNYFKPLFLWKHAQCEEELLQFTYARFRRFTQGLRNAESAI